MKSKVRWVLLGGLSLVVLLTAWARPTAVLASSRQALIRLGLPSEGIAEALAQAYETRAEQMVASGSEEAEVAYVAAIGVWQSLGNEDRMASVRGRLGALQMDRGQTETALEQFSQNLYYFSKVGQQEKVVDTLLWMGHCRSRRGEFDLAVKLLEEAEGSAEELDYHLGAASAANILGYVHQQLGTFEVALTHYRRATEQYQELGRSVDVASTWDNRAGCLMVLGRLREARSALETALELKRKNGVSAGMAITLTQQGWLQALDQEPEKALAAYRQALEILKGTGNRLAQVGVLDRMGSAFVDEGRFAEARASYLEAAQLAIPGTSDEAQISANLCRLGVLEGRRRDEQGYCRLGLEFFEHAAEPSKEASSAYWAGRQSAAEGDLERAQSLAERSVSILEKLRLEVGTPIRRSQYFNDRLRYYRFLIEVFARRHQKSPQEGFDTRAFEASEKMRARSLLDLLRTNLPEREQEELKAVLREESELRRRLLDRNSAPADSDSKIAALEERYERVESWLREQLSQPTSFTATHDVESLLEEGTLLLAYSLGEKVSYLFVLDSSSLSLYELPPKDEIEALAAAYFAQSSSPDSLWAQAQVQLIGMRLAAALLGPAADKLEGRRLVVVPDGLVAYVPFAALPDPANPEEPLVSRFEIASLPSLTILEALRDRPRRKLPTFATLVVADPVYGSEDSRLGRRRTSGSGGGWPRLTGTAQEAELLRQWTPGSLQALTGFEARRDVILGGALKGFSLIHFATHGWIDAETPEESALLLSAVDQDGKPLESHLKVRDLFSLDLDAELVVASACRTGLSGEARGEGMTSFTSGFLLAGSNRVVVSLWPIEDGTTALLMGKFYEALFDRKLSPAAALRFAQLEIRKNPKTVAPFYWSAFVLQGDWRGFPIPARRDKNPN